MPEIAVKSMKNDTLKEISISEEVFSYPLKEHLIYEAVLHYRASGRSGSANTKNRVEVHGGGRKPWRQKGTGRARVGTIRSPLWRGGGIVFGPKPRDYGYHMPKKMIRNALKSILSAKYQEERILVLDDLELESHKTKELKKVLSEVLGIKGKALIVYEGENKNLELAVRNNRRLKLIRALALNPYDALDNEWLVMNERALLRLNEVLAK
jgi:large subunit ribosomal protein L4